MAELTAYTELITYAKRLGLLQSIQELLEWDEHVYLPAGGSEYRAEQAAYLAGMRHEAATSPKLRELIETAVEEVRDRDTLTAEAVNVREMLRDYDRAIKLPQELVEELSRTHSKANQAWVQARKDKDFSLFEPHLGRVFKLAKEVADCYGYTDDPYDALLEDYEPYARSKQITPLLHKLREALIPLVERAAASKTQPDQDILRRTYPVVRQEAFAKQVVAKFGYDFTNGRLDPTVHPFCISPGPQDVRITTRYDENWFPGAFFSVLHEGGHGMYEQGALTEDFGTPMGTAVSLGVHESQSRMWENMVGRSHAFWEFWFSKAQQHFTALADVTLDQFHFAVNTVKPSYIRVEADEVTYNLHILLRAELEMAMLHGDLPIEDLPGAWNEKFKEYFGIDVPDDAMGCLQDVHWSMGLIGYFPTYSLGNLYAAQLFSAAEKEIGDVDGLFRQGEFTPLLDWLRKNVHTQGRRFAPADLIEAATGAQPDSAYLVSYLTGKIEALYD